MQYNTLKISKTEKISLLTLNRPQQLNALNIEVLKELDIAINELKETSRVIIITGEGKKAFAAGADIKEFSNFNTPQGTELSKSGQDVFNRISTSKTPIIAAINGFVLGGGLELAMSCHFRVCSENAKFGLPEVSLGVIPGYGGTQRLVELVGKGKALEMMLSANMINSEAALKCGLVNHVFSQEQLINETIKIATKIAFNSPNAIAEVINCVNTTINKTGYSIESTKFGECFETKEFKEGVSAFLEKRKPKF